MKPFPLSGVDWTKFTVNHLYKHLEHLEQVNHLYKHLEQVNHLYKHLELVNYLYKNLEQVNHLYKHLEHLTGPSSIIYI